MRFAAIIGVAVAVAGCGGHPATEPAPLFGGATTAVTAPPTGDIAHLSAVRLSSGDGQDRLEFEFTDRVPGYTVGYQPLPARADASGAEIPLPGADAMVQIAFNPATAEGWGGGARTYSGAASLSAAGGSVTEAKSAGDFEAVLTWVVGLRSVVPFRVEALDGPPRLAVTFGQ